MSPEQLNGQELTPQSDVFALGTVLAYAATGHDPFEAPTMPAVITRILTGPPDLDPLTGDLRGIIADCLAKDPGDRPEPGRPPRALQRPPNPRPDRDRRASASPRTGVAPRGSSVPGTPAGQGRRGSARRRGCARNVPREHRNRKTCCPPGPHDPSAPAARSAGDAPAGSEVPEAGERTARPAPPTSIVHAGPIRLHPAPSTACRLNRMTTAHLSRTSRKHSQAKKFRKHLRLAAGAASRAT